MRFFMFYLPLLAAAALHGHGKVHKHAHALAHRGIATEVVTVTVSQIVTVTVKDDVSSATPSSVSVVELMPSSSALPTLPTFQVPAEGTTSTVDKGVKPFPTLEPVPGSAMILNSCHYPVFIWSAGHTSCAGDAATAKRIEPNDKHIEALRTCPEGGISLKVSKTETAAHPMQFEYSVWPNHVMVSYDISYLDCMVNTNGEKDLSGCAGHDGGIQASGGGDCPDYHCLAGEWCDAQAYVVAEFGYQAGAPVGGCTVDKGIAFELCAGHRV